MRCIYDHCPCLCRNLLLKLLKIRLECGCIRRDFHKPAIKIAHICTIFQKVWCKNNHFFLWIQDRLENHIQTAGCSNCHNQILRRKFSSKAAIQRFRNRLAHILKSCITHITMNHCRLHFVHQINNSLLHALRCRNARIPKTEIINFVRTVNGSETISLLKHHTDG